MIKSLILSITLLSSLAVAQIQGLEHGTPLDTAGSAMVAYFGVKSCGKYAIWVLLENGHFIRYDEKQYPPANGWGELMKQLRGLPADVVEIECPTTI